MRILSSLPHSTSALLEPDQETLRKTLKPVILEELSALQTNLEKWDSNPAVQDFRKKIEEWIEGLSNGSPIKEIGEEIAGFSASLASSELEGDNGSSIQKILDLISAARKRIDKLAPTYRQEILKAQFEPNFSENKVSAKIIEETPPFPPSEKSLPREKSREGNLEANPDYQNYLSDVLSQIRDFQPLPLSPAEQKELNPEINPHFVDQTTASQILEIFGRFPAGTILTIKHLWEILPPPPNFRGSLNEQLNCFYHTIFSLTNQEGNFKLGHHPLGFFILPSTASPDSGQLTFRGIPLKETFFSHEGYRNWMGRITEWPTLTYKILAVLGASGKSPLLSLEEITQQINNYFREPWVPDPFQNISKLKRFTPEKILNALKRLERITQNLPFKVFAVQTETGFKFGITLNSFSLPETREQEKKEKEPTKENLAEAEGLFEKLKKSDTIHLNPQDEQKLLSPEEQKDLLKKWRKKADRPAFEKLCHSFKFLILKIANQYRNRGMDFADLVQEGNLGLLTGLEKYDSGKSCRISTYVTWWITQAITRAIQNQSRTIRIPTHIQNMRTKINKCLRLNPHASLSEIAEKTSIPLKKVKELFCIPLPSSVSYNTGLKNKNGENEEGFDRITPDPHQIEKDFLEKDFFGKLGQTIKTVLSRNPHGNYEKNWENLYIFLRYFSLHSSSRLRFSKKTLDDIGIETGLTRERIRQILVKDLKELRKNPLIKEFKRVL